MILLKYYNHLESFGIRTKKRRKKKDSAMKKGNRVFDRSGYNVVEIRYEILFQGFQGFSGVSQAPNRKGGRAKNWQNLDWIISSPKRRKNE